MDNQEQDPKEVARRVYDDNLTKSQYSVSPVPAHNHDGVTNPQFPFTNLADVPPNYVGFAGQNVIVNSTETGLTFASGFASGMMNMYGGASAPSGWLLCDGASYLRTTYPALYTAIGTTFGSADGTHFNVPDMRGRLPIGTGTGTGGGLSGTGLPTGGTALTARSLGAWLGEETHTLITTEMPSHVHTVGTSNPGGGNAPVNGSYTAPGSAQITSMSPAGGDGAHNNIQPTMTVNFIIKT